LSIKTVKPVGQMTCTLNHSDDAPIYRITNNNVHEILEVTDKGRGELIHFIETYCHLDVDVENSLVEIEGSYSEKSKYRKLRIFSRNAFKQGFNFSLSGLLALQVIIIPENFIGIDVPLFVTRIYTFIVMLILGFISARTYRKAYMKSVKYWPIFRLTASFTCCLYLLLDIEMLIIDLFSNEKFSLPSQIFLLFIALIFGIFMAFVYTPIYYYANGGKVVINNEKKIME
jgi:hypothetical protein